METTLSIRVKPSSFISIRDQETSRIGVKDSSLYQIGEKVLVEEELNGISTSKNVIREISYILRGEKWGLEKGLLILGLKKLEHGKTNQ